MATIPKLFFCLKSSPNHGMEANSLKFAYDYKRALARTTSWYTGNHLHSFELIYPKCN